MRLARASLVLAGQEGNTHKVGVQCAGMAQRASWELEPCVCVRERESERGGEKKRHIECEWEGEREAEQEERQGDKGDFPPGVALQSRA